MVTQIIFLSLPAICNIASLQLLVIFIYALLGMQTFATASFEGAAILGERLNFRNFGNAIFSLVSLQKLFVFF